MGNNSTKDLVGKYTTLKKQLDCDMFNTNWTLVDTKSSIDKTFKYNFIDLFSGAGGISFGLHEANFEKVFSNEIDCDASATIRHNFPESVHFEGRIEDLSEEDVLSAVNGKKIHLVIGGPPCQGFSVAGLRKIEDPRNKLFLEFKRIVEITNPWFVIMENVPGILTLDKGAFYHAVIAEFGKVGYEDMAVRILEAANFGVPQFRSRAIFVGNRFGQTNPYPKEMLEKNSYKPIESAIKDLADVSRDPFVNHEWTDHSEQMTQRLAKVPPGGSLYDSYRDAWKRQYVGVPSMTIKENHGGVHIHPWLNRVLSAREMARLQTFPDRFFFKGTMKRAMWQIGNAVPPLLAYHIGLALRPLLDEIRLKKV